MKLEDLIGEDILIQTVRERFHAGKILTAYPDGTADILVFAYAGAGVYIRGNVAFGAPNTLNCWWFRKLPEKLAEVFSRCAAAQPKEEKVEPAAELFADEPALNHHPEPVLSKSLPRKAGSKAR